MTTVSVSKREGLSPFFERSFEDVSEAARFAESWLPMHVVIRNESGQPIDLYSLIHAGEPAQPVRADESGHCPFCGAAETPILADDECLHACAQCDRHWYIDADQNVLAADRCPSCEAAEVLVSDEGIRACGACGREFFFDGLTYVDPVEGGVS